MSIKSVYKNIKEIAPHVLKHKVPSSVYKELQKCVKQTDKIKNHELSCLRAHENVGNNLHQVFIPFNLIESSFLQAYLIYLGECYRCKYENLSLQDTRRTVRLRKNGNHFDSYDCWVNYSEKNSINGLHDHGGTLSGVIYYNDCTKSPTYFENGFSYAGKKGDIIIFPASLRHGVKKHKNKKTRLTISYNLYFTQ
tara:strand:- start:1110 stop:1694 length:585 start_codon:yes stop_codon:yes gene_type:complete